MTGIETTTFEATRVPLGLVGPQEVFFSVGQFWQTDECFISGGGIGIG
jgi:hypothetical protein